MNVKYQVCKKLVEVANVVCVQSGNYLTSCAHKDLFKIVFNFDNLQFSYF